MNYLISDYMATINFSENLKRALEKKGMTIADLARKSGIHYVTVHGYLTESKRGKYPELKNLIRLSEALDCRTSDLTGKTDADIEYEKSLETLRAEIRVYSDGAQTVVIGEEAYEIAVLLKHITPEQREIILKMIRSQIKSEET